MGSPLYAITVSFLRGDAVHLDVRSLCEAVRDVAHGPLRNLPVVAMPPDRDGLHRTGIRLGDPRLPAAAKAYHAALDPIYTQGSRLSPSRMPSAVLRIQVDDPTWLSHLAVGMLWDSYAFDDAGPILY